MAAPPTEKQTCVMVPISSSDDQQLDFIGPSNAVKDLFTLPYSLDKSVSVAVHNMNGTLLIDADTVVVNDSSAPRRRRRHKRQRPKIPHETDAALAVVTSMLQLENKTGETNKDGKPDGTWNSTGELLLPPPENYTSVPPPERPREYLSWKFRGLNLMVGSDAFICRHDAQDALAIRIEDTSTLSSLVQKHQQMVRQGQFVADYNFPSKSYADVLAPKQIQAPKNPSLYAAPDLKHVELQTCIVPSNTSPLGALLSRATVETTPSSSPVCTVMDAYLDNIMANVPQLALCLREKGFIQSVKLIQTEQIPSSLMHASTLDPLAALPGVDEPPIFSPQIMEMNASTLLRFLKSNCTKDNATYLLRREAGEQNVQLYDVTAISASRQRKWIWWLAMMSYRFALRLGQMMEMEDAARKRQFRDRKRGLLTTCLELLHDLNDMDGGAHETLCASVEEHLADTFLKEDGDGPHPSSESFPAMTASQQPYSCVSIDSLNKAQDHLKSGIRVMWVLLNRTEEQEKETREKLADSPRRRQVVHVHSEDSSSDDDDSNSDESSQHVSYGLQSISMQLFGLLHKSINVSLRLAEYHLQNYFSSSAMRELRSAARRISDGTTLLRHIGGDDDICHLKNTLQCQYTWLWEHCGHFARSFAADELWRDRGHACGDDVISVLRDAEAALSLSNISRGQSKPSSWMEDFSSDASLTKDTNGSVTLLKVSGIIDVEMESSDPDMDAHRSGAAMARKLLEQQRQIQRDKLRVLVAACVSYSRAIDSIQKLSHIGFSVERPPPSTTSESSLLSMLQQRLGDGCNEIGKILLNELRSLLSGQNSNLTASERPAVAGVLLSSAEVWFNEGLRVFQDCNDVCNIALLRCNLCQCCKLQTNSNCSSQSTESVSDRVEFHLQGAIEQLQKAHDALGDRDTNPRIWDMISNELAATFLVLGVRRRQSLLGGGTMPLVMQSFRLAPGKEKSIIDPMERAVEIYSKVGNIHQEAAANYQLALFYSKVWTCQRDEAKTRDKLARAFQHFGSAYGYFSRAPAGNESTFVILSLDLANLYAVVSGKEGLSKALACCLDTATAFSFESIDAALERQDNAEWLQRMSTLASSLEEQIFKFLVNLVKIEKDSGGGETLYREMYRNGLKSKMAMKTSEARPGTPDFLSAFHEILLSIKETS